MTTYLFSIHIFLLLSTMVSECAYFSQDSNNFSKLLLLSPQFMLGALMQGSLGTQASNSLPHIAIFHPI